MKFYQIQEEGFSFHTFELKKQITYENYRAIKNSLFMSAKREKHRAYLNGRCLVSERYKVIGVIIRLCENPGYPPHLELRVNPRTLCGANSPVGIFHCTPENIGIVERKINLILKGIQADFNFNHMTLSRIDLCVNVQMAQPYVDAYMRVVRKCKLPESIVATGSIKMRAIIRKRINIPFVQRIRVLPLLFTIRSIRQSKRTFCALMSIRRRG